MFSKMFGKSRVGPLGIRELILESAVGVLVSNGLSTFSLSSVASRAEISSGALFTHFPTRTALVGEMCKYLFDKLEKEFVKVEIDPNSTPGDRVEDLIDAVVGIYSDTRMLAALELYGACRTDQDLSKFLSEIDRERSPHHVNLAELIISAPHVSHDEIARFVHLVVFSVQGMALDSLANRDPQIAQVLRDYLVELGRKLVEPHA